VKGYGHFGSAKQIDGRGDAFRKINKQLVGVEIYALEETK